MNRGFVGCVLVVAMWGWGPSAQAAPLPFAAQLDIGKPHRPAALRVMNVPAGVELLIGTVRHTLEGVVASTVDSEVIALQGGGSIAAIVVHTAAGRHLVLIGKRGGRLAIIWSNIDGLRGDPGERRGHELLREDRDGDGHVDVGIAERHEAVRTCDGTPLSVRARWVNPTTLDLDAESSLLTLSAGQTTTEARHLEAASSPPDVRRERPRVQVLRARWASTEDAGAPLADLATGGSLLDGDRAQPWNMGHGIGARAVLGVLGSGLRISHLAISVAGTRPEGSGGFLFRGDHDQWFHVTLPATSATDGRYWITLPTPAAWGCLELAAPPTGAHAGEMPAISEVEAFTEVDRADGIDVLLGRVITDDEHGSDAANVLTSLGEIGVAALQTAWERLGARGQRRAILAFATRAGDSPLARRALMTAASVADAEMGSRALAALVRVARVAHPELAELAESHGTLGATAARALGQTGVPESVPALLRLLTTAGGADRPALRHALADAIARPTDTTTPAITAWIASAPPTPALASALMVLAAARPARPEPLAIWASLVSRPLEFSDLWRMTLAASALGESSEVDRWLARQAATGGVTWMLRDAALVSLRERHSSLAIEAALAAREDESPRVRATAIGILGTTPEHRATLVAGLNDEVWPIARVALVQQAVGLPDAPALLRRALKDRAVPVRVAAIEGLVRAGDRSSWPLVAERLRDNNESPAVMSAGIQLAVSLCITDATDGLRPLLRRGLKPDTWAPDIDLAIEAIAALGHFGTEHSRRLLASLQNPEHPAVIRETAKRAATAAACVSPDASPSSTVTN